ncbi:hypothetical protein Asi03nite_56760 [Actinoplanes siamensis]|uniref:Uncharacterized protein n=1 Tax=Actinoplanes siamensis TaxID=1223317 RepID=A0A919TNF1_9ACTN|nr:hypothetical protein Asi03nite_56760 [Actinoplanes siamensis]
MRGGQDPVQHRARHGRAGELGTDVAPASDDLVQVVRHGQAPAALCPGQAGAIGREAGLRTPGSSPRRPPSQPVEASGYACTRVGGSSPVTAAGPCRIRTGFPILPAAAGGAPRNSSCRPAPYPKAVTAGPANYESS